MKEGIEEGKELGVNGTPMFFLGYIQAEAPFTVTAFKRLRGSVSFREFDSALQDLLRESESLGQQANDKVPLKGKNPGVNPFFNFEGPFIKAVAVPDLERVWRILGESVVDDRAQHSAQKQADERGGDRAVQAPSVGFSRSFLERECSPGADVFAVFLRATFLNVLIKMGTLREWQHGQEISPAVFSAAANFSFPYDFNKVDIAEFTAYVKSSAGRSGK